VGRSKNKKNAEEKEGTKTARVKKKKGKHETPREVVKRTDSHEHKLKVGLVEKGFKKARRGI